MKHIRKNPPSPAAPFAETPSRRPAVPTHLFHFTDREELWIARACCLAADFMQTYGRGYRPRPIDTSHYIQSATDNKDRPQ